ncbi:DgyrCDS7698 [Dimorphilus gyrociliatus]|uniref:DgyrCDS7698 n=1 Tax=Dimorphilus gyrociliatus TaxID=2664684 RepID=A0A7I8VRX7_9ANNE|nr:DgyrCDS7698 [Dimorphilus gyrociliatus]
MATLEKEVPDLGRIAEEARSVLAMQPKKSILKVRDRPLEAQSKLDILVKREEKSQIQIINDNKEQTIVQEQQKIQNELQNDLKKASKLSVVNDKSSQNDRRDSKDSTAEVLESLRDINKEINTIYPKEPRTSLLEWTGYFQFFACLIDVCISAIGFKGTKKTVIAHISVLCLFFFNQPIIIVMFILYKDLADNYLKLHMLNMIKYNYRQDDETQIVTYNETSKFGINNYAKQWNYLQSKYKCCGVLHPNDYWNRTNYNFFFVFNQTFMKRGKIPASCCKKSHNPNNLLNYLEDKDAKNCLNNTLFVYERGCFKIMQIRLQTYSDIVKSFTISTILLKIMLIITAVYYLRKLRRPIKRRKLIYDTNSSDLNTAEVEEEEDEDDMQDMSKTGSKNDLSSLMENIAASGADGNILPFLLPFLTQYQMMNPAWQRKIRNLQKITALNAQMQLEKLQEEEAARKRKEKTKEIKEQVQEGGNVLLEDENMNDKQKNKPPKSVTNKGKLKKETKTKSTEETKGVAKSGISPKNDKSKAKVESDKLAVEDVKIDIQESKEKVEFEKKDDTESNLIAKDKLKTSERKKEDDKNIEDKIEKKKSDASIGSMAKRRSERYLDRLTKQKSSQRLPFDLTDRERRSLFPKYSRRTLDLYKEDSRKVETIDQIINEATTTIKNDQDRIKNLSTLGKLGVKKQESTFTWRTSSRADLFQMKTDNPMKKRSFFKDQSEQLLADRDFEKKRQESEAHLQELLERMKKTASNFRLQRRFSKDQDTPK